jgi:hypothetical protein
MDWQRYNERYASRKREEGTTDGKCHPWLPSVVVSSASMQDRPTITENSRRDLNESAKFSLLLIFEA